MKYQRYKTYYRRYFRKYIHRPKEKLRRKLYRESAKGKKIARLAKLKYRYQNGGAVKDAEWKNKNQDRIWGYKRNYKHRRREWEKNGDGITKAEWIEICRKYNWRCWICGKRKKLEIDHVRPLSKKGKHTKKNIRPACRQCNCKKSNKLWQI